jgi:hypothetical protein
VIIIGVFGKEGLILVAAASLPDLMSQPKRRTYDHRIKARLIVS